MTIALSDRIDMAETDETDEITLDEMFERLERMPVPEGYKVEVVEGTLYMSPQRYVHWDTIAAIFEQLRTRHPRQRIVSDVRFHFPGLMNGFCPDVVLLSKDARRDDAGRWRCEDVGFVAEVVSQSTAENDYGPKKAIYAYCGVPAYLVVDPYRRLCHLYTEPEQAESEDDRLLSGYASDLTVKYGLPMDLSGTPAEIKLATAEFQY